MIEVVSVLYMTERALLARKQTGKSDTQTLRRLYSIRNAILHADAGSQAASSQKAWRQRQI